MLIWRSECVRWIRFRTSLFLPVECKSIFIENWRRYLFLSLIREENYTSCVHCIVTQGKFIDPIQNDEEK
jgi:hypothetical protein